MVHVSRVTNDCTGVTQNRAFGVLYFGVGKRYCHSSGMTGVAVLSLSGTYLMNMKLI